MENFFWFYDSFFSKKECDDIINHIKSNYEQKLASISDSYNLGSVNKLHRDSLMWLVSVNDLKIFKEVMFFVVDSNSYNFKFDIDYDKKEEMNLLLYESDGHFDFHTDQPFTKKQSTIRKLTCIIQLSDSKEYEGGDLEFLFLGKDPLTYPEFRNQGSVIVFPSFILHKISPIISGQRHSLVSWWSGPAFK